LPTSVAPTSVPPPAPAGGPEQLPWQSWPGFLGHAFDVELPGPPLEGREWAETPEGRAEITTWSVSVGSETYLVAHCEFARAPLGNSSATLEAVAGGFLATWEGQVVARREVLDPNQPALRGVDLDLASEAGAGGPVTSRVRIILLDRALTQLVAAARGTELPAHATRLFDSYRPLRLPPEAPPEPAAPPRPWSRYASTELGFAVMAPGEPATRSAPAKSEVGMLELIEEVFPGGRDDATLAVLHADYPKEAIRGGIDRFLEEARDGLVASLGARLARSEAIALGQRPGLELELEIPGQAGPVVVLARTLVTESRLFVVLALGRAGRPRDDARRFVSSFELP
jgi:hypothetical protein